MNPPKRIPGNTDSGLRLRMLLVAAGLAFGAATLVGSCASTPEQPHSMRDPQADFNAFKTFGWNAGTDTQKADQPVSLADGYIRSAIKTELTRRGYVEAAEGTVPDLRVEYETVSTEKVKNSPFRVGVGVGSWGGHAGGSVGVGSPSVRNVKEGTLVVHFIDSARKSEVWEGRASRELGRGKVEPAAVQSAVADLLRDFPARSTRP